MAESDELQSIIEGLPQQLEKLRDLRELVLANAVMLGEIPAPTFGEESRIRFLQDRFTESNLQNISTDEAGNGTAILPGRTGERNILISAHADTIFDASVDHTMSVQEDRINGNGIADNSLGLAVVASLPTILERLDIQLDANLILLGATRSLGRGDLAGLRFFLENAKTPIHAAVCLEGVHLGRLSYSCLGMLRGEIICTSKLDSGGAIAVMNRLISRMLAIRIPQEPRTSIILGSLNAGKGFKSPPLSATLRFEIRSEQSGLVGELLEELNNIIDELNAETESELSLQVLARRSPGGIGFTHPLVRSIRQIMQELNVQPRMAPSVGDLSAVISRGIPGVTLGLTHGFNKDPGMESVEVEPLFAGIAQVVAAIQSIDKGVCDDED